MANITIVGGGLTGLSAAFELERLKIPYTLIEVKARLGGSIITHRESGFVLDGAAFVLEKYGEWAWLSDLDLPDPLVSIGKYRDGELVVFRGGTQTLTDALQARISAPILTRMAVSSLGMLHTAAGARIGVCLENGVLLETRGVIVAAPARYAGHMLWSLSPHAAALLDGFQYDPVVRVSLGFRRAGLAAVEKLPDAPPGVKFLESYTLAERVPADHVLVRAGVRLDGAITTPAAALAHLRDLLPVPPVLSWAHYWAEADPLTRHLPEHAEAMHALDSALPPNVIVVGSDYRAMRLDQQVEQGREAARRLAARL